MTARHFEAKQCNHSPRGSEYRLNEGNAVFSVRAKACASLLALLVFPPLAQAQNPVSATCPKYGTQDLLTMPEIKSQDGVLRAEIKLADGLRTVWGSVGIPEAGSNTDNRCASQYMRFFEGYDPAHPQPWPGGPEPMPGPTLRARVGDLIEITFQNLINTQHFANSLDLGEQGKTPGCDEVFANTQQSDWAANTVYKRGAGIKPTTNNAGGYVFTATQHGRGTSGATSPTFPQTPGQTVTDGTVVWTNEQVSLYPGLGGDKMPDCLHGSSTANLHFHGTHTTPSTTGDNVLLYIRPAMRTTAGGLEPTNAFVKDQFAQIFSACEKDGSPGKWEQLPKDWRDSQENLLQKYDATAPYKGQPGSLPHSMQLWPPNEAELAQGLWPQYQIGAYPYCFRLTKYIDPPGPGDPLMGQAPGTHWYHAHKHGSTALNVATGMTGAFVIEGQYDDDLHKFYGPKLREQVLMLQQISTTPFPLLDPTHTGGPGWARPPISVNGRRNPVVTMQPGEVQLWRIVNGAFRDAVQFVSFTAGASGQAPAWRQIAQDGVQFDFANYHLVGALNNSFNLAPANRADLLVKAPTQPGTYVLQASANTGSLIQTCPATPAPPPPPPPGICQAAVDTRYPFTLLTVNVTGNPVSPAMDFIQNEKDFPQFPKFLADIPESSFFTKRKLVFGPGDNTIDGQSFNPNQVNQAMLLNTTEEWTVMNQANDKSHPFHIHINPFQVVEVFEPNRPEAITPGNPCYVNPNDPATFKPCRSQQPQAPFVWWDTFAIPTGQQIDITQRCTDPKKVQTCPVQLQPYTQCTAGTCTEYIPGWFKMRTRFADFTGDYVLHCHILIHEDRGMMQLIEVVSDKTLYTHH